MGSTGSKPGLKKPLVNKKSQKVRFGSSHFSFMTSLKLLVLVGLLTIMFLRNFCFKGLFDDSS